MSVALTGFAWLLVVFGLLCDVGNLVAVVHNLRHGSHRSLVLGVPWVAYGAAGVLWRAAGEAAPWRIVALFAALHLVWWLGMGVAMLRKERSPQNRSEERP